MNQDNTRRKTLAAAIPLLLTTSLMALGAPAAADDPVGVDALMGSLHPQLQRNLDLAGALGQTEDPFAAAKLATAWQAATLGVPLERMDAPQHASPSAAVLALTARHGVVPSLDQAAQIAALDDLPTQQRDALTGVVDAFLALEDATRIAYQGADLDALTAMADVDPEDAADIGEGIGLVESGVQVGLILGTRNGFLDAVQAFQDVFPDVAPSMTTSSSSPPGVDLCPAIALDLDGIDTTYEDNCALVLDVGGNDTYHNNAGGSNILGTATSCALGEHASAALIDLSGNDQYGDPSNPWGCGTNGGGAWEGTGFLYDGSGDDTYTAGNRGTNGGAREGTGFLYDGSGDDTYTAGSDGTNGGARYTATGFLYDGSGDDTYTAGNGGTNGGSSNFGKGFLYDGSGDDTYTAGNRGTNGGSSNFGTGFLYDGSGIDSRSDNNHGSCSNADTVDCTVVPKGTVGAFIDFSSPPTPVIDGDGDGVPDEIESQLCGRPIVQQTIDGTTGEFGHFCRDSADYSPPTTNTTLSVPVGVQPGPDADGDGSPATITVQRVNVTVRPFGGGDPVTVSPAPDHVEPFDPDDNDPEQPAPSTVTFTLVTGVSFGDDVDNDGVPSTVTVTTSTVTVDRRDPGNPTITPAATQTEPVDPDDNDPDNPAASTFGPVTVPIGATHSGDADGDMVPGSMTVTYLNVTIDRTQSDPVIQETWTETYTLDPDEGDPDDPVPFSVVDADMDFVPDEAEPWICQVQNTNDPEDGKCVQADGSGSDGSGENYVPPAGVPNPWN